MSSSPNGGSGGGGAPSGRIVADDHALRLADALVASELNEEVLHETLDAAEEGTITESGRTVCSSLANVQAPIERHPMAVDLAGCRPWDATGIIHSHVTPDELRNPTHSLPDVANVLYGHANASVIPGTETTHVVARPTDQTIPEARSVFDNVIGVDVESPEDVSRAVDEGAIVDLENAQSRLMDQLAPIVSRVEQPRREVDARLDELGMDEDLDGMVASEMAFMSTEGGDGPPRGYPDTDPAPDEPTTSRTHEAAQRHRRIATRLRQSVDDDTSGFIRATIVSNVIGTVVGGVVSRAVFGD